LRVLPRRHEPTSEACKEHDRQEAIRTALGRHAGTIGLAIVSA